MQADRSLEGVQWKGEDDMRQRVILLILLVVGLAFGGYWYAENNRKYEAEWPVMGTVAKFQAKGRLASDEVEAFRKVASENMARLEKLLSAHDPESEMNRLFAGGNRVPGTLPDGISEDVVPCYKMAFKLRELSGGAFDPYWKGEGKIDLGAIAKGFALDDTLAKLRQDYRFSHEGAKYMLDLGGNLLALSGSWSTGIRDPDSEVGIARRIVLEPGFAAATSGEYERGKHIYDGRTGKPVENDVASVTAVHPNSAMLADGLSTTLFVLGRDKGTKFLADNFPEARAYWVMK